jgi:hypothetical protein
VTNGVTPVAIAIPAKEKATRGRPRGVKRPIAAQLREVADLETRQELQANESKRGQKPTQRQARLEVVEIMQVSQVDTMDTDEGDMTQLETLPETNSSETSLPRRITDRPPSAESRRPDDAPSLDLNDCQLRRRLGEATKKIESLETKYRDLRETGVKEAERNFDRLRKQSEERSNSK